MPTYEYQCTECGHAFETFQQMSDPRLETCPECGRKLRRLIGTGSGIIFKGAGFYATDYRGSSVSSTGAGTPPERCNRSAPCCGRETPCGKSPRQN